jgi:AcrR family transcriptional regulator
MASEVKPRRRYESARRREQATQTRNAIITAAGRLFRDRSYRVSMPVIASEAGVAVETVYRIFGTKSALFSAAIDSLLAGGIARADMPVEERPAIRAIINEPDPRRQVALYARTQPGIHRRAGPTLRALRDAKFGDPELERMWVEVERRRYAGQRRFVERLNSQGSLRRGLSLDTATDILWSMCSLAVYDLLVIDRDWADDTYEEWLTAVLIDMLLAEHRTNPGC